MKSNVHTDQMLVGDFPSSREMRSDGAFQREPTTKPEARVMNIVQLELQQLQCRAFFSMNVDYDGYNNLMWRHADVDMS